jgi:CelD/BcsL family acetyltransferase involved in cellulose biosynthesis
MRDDAYEFHTVTDRAELERLKAEWNEIVPPAASEPWQSFSWINACAHTFNREHRLRVITVRRNGRLVAAAPLVLRPSPTPLKPPRLYFLSGEDVLDPKNFIARNSAELDILIDHLARKLTAPIKLSRIPDNDHFTSRLAARLRGSGWLTMTRRVPYPYLDLDESWSDPVRKYKYPQDLRRARHRANRRGSVQFEVISPRSSADLREPLAEAFRVEAAGWKGRTGSAIVHQERRRAFLEQLAASAVEDGTLRLAFLRIDGRVAAMQYAMEAAAGYWLLKIGYDEAFKECSPGLLLIAETIRACTQQGLARYHFLGVNEPWVARWTAAAKECVTFVAYRPNFGGLRSFLSDAIDIGRKRVAQRTRPGRGGASGRAGMKHLE